MKSPSLSRLLALASIAAVLLYGVLDYHRVYYRGPASDHFDGRRFFSPEGAIGKGLWDVLHWQLTAERAEWPDAVPLAKADLPPPRVEGAGLRVSFVGHATMLVQAAGLNLLTDPIWSERASLVSWAGPRRVTPPGIAFEALPRIDAVLVSHSHYDHMDLATLKRLNQRDAPLFVVPLGNDVMLREAMPQARIAALDWWQHTALGEARLHAVPVYHWSRRGAFDRNKALWSGFVIETAHGKIYFAGDTGFGAEGAHFRETAGRFGGFRLALLPVGAYEPRWFMKNQHVNPDEAVRMHRLLGAETSIGLHLATFQLTDEAIDQPQRELAAARTRHGIPPERFVTLPVGGAWNAPSPMAP